MIKAVILAGGLGTRMREETEFKPKPMVEVGNLPVLLHLMRLLGAQGISEFVICVGYRGDYIRDYFLNLRSRFLDFTVDTSRGDSIVFHPSAELPDWRITIAETGALTPTGGRIKRVEPYVQGDRFLVTYGDGLADVSISKLLECHEKSGRIATVTTTQPRSRFGVLTRADDGTVTSFLEKPEGKELVNMGFFIFEPEVFNYLDDDSVLETSPLDTLVKMGELNSFVHDGFFRPMDTQREVDDLRLLWDKGQAPWKLW